MPQIFQVLKCYKCSVFQVHQSKKSNKWECKMCGDKQSVKRHYGLGTAKDCRLHVQKLNGIRGEVDELKQIDKGTDDEFENVQPQTTNLLKESRWSSYVEDAAPLTVDNNRSMYLNDTEVVLELPQKRKKISNNHHKNKVVKHQMFDKEVDELSQSIDKEESCYLNQKSELEQNSIENRFMISEPCKNDKYEKYLDTSGSKCFIKMPGPPLSIESHHSNGEVNTSKQIIKKFRPPTINKNSKWAEYVDEDEEESTEDIENVMPCGEHKQFCEDTEIYKDPSEETENLFSPCTEQSQNKINTLFALCDDGDLDSVFNI